jgi:hypothetical protein
MKPNHLIIGLGGTGGKVIRSFVKSVKRNQRAGLGSPVNIQYLYVDSSREMMADDDPTWKVLGENVQLKPANQLHLDGGQVAAMLADPYSYQGVKKWIGEPEQWRSIINLGSGATILGGQKRRLGRLLIAAKIRDFLSMVDGLVKGLTNNNTSAVTFHVCCGLAGGTGSGALIDVISQLRKKFPEGNQHKILLYLLLPDRFPKANWDTGNYHANGYSALLELNALGAGLFHPCDITGDQEKHAGNKKEDAPFNSCYLMTNENENGLVLDVENDVPNTLAAFLYEKIVASEELKYDDLSRHERFENRNLEPEGTGPEKQRCRKFIAFGINQLLYPELEIMEFFTYRLADQAASQMLQNHWTGNDGYIVDPIAFDVQSYVESRRDVWKLNIASLQLEQPVFGVDLRPEEKTWRNIQEDWTDFVQRIRQDITADVGGEWIRLLSEHCQDRYLSKYRSVGVENFYKDKRRSREEYSREIVRAVEMDLLSSWGAGNLGSTQAVSVLEVLADRLSQLSRECQENSEKAKVMAEDREAKLKTNFREWQDIGRFARVLKKHETLFEAAVSNIVSLYESRTIIAASGFAVDLMDQIKGKVMDLKGQFQRLSANLQEVHETMQKRAAARCNDRGEDFDTQMVRLYSPKAVRDVIAGFCADRNIQASQTARVRSALLARVGDTATAHTLSNLGAEVLSDALEASCSESARDLHTERNQDLRANGDAILGMSIIDKLEQRYKGNPDKMRQEITRLVERSLSFVPFDNSEVLKSGPGAMPDSQTQNRVRSLLILHPTAPDKASFLTGLQETFRSAWKSGGDGVKFIGTQEASDQKGHQMTILSLASLFPLRFVSVLSVLHEKYRQRMSSAEPKRAQLELHIEGDGSQYPALYIPSVLEQGLPLMLMGVASGVIQRENTSLFIEVMQFDSQNRPTIPRRVPLGESLKGFLERLPEGTLMEDLIRQTDEKVTEKLTSHAATSDDLRNALIQESSALRQREKGYDADIGRGLNEAINRIDRIASRVSATK